MKNVKEFANDVAAFFGECGVDYTQEDVDNLVKDLEAREDEAVKRFASFIGAQLLTERNSLEVLNRLDAAYVINKAAFDILGYACPDAPKFTIK